VSVAQARSVKPGSSRKKSKPRRPGGTLALSLGLGGAALLMMWEQRLSFGIPLGSLLMCVGVWGVLDRLGYLNAPVKKATKIIDANPASQSWILALLGSFAAIAVSTIAASRGVLPGHGAMAGVLITASTLSALFSMYGVVDAVGALPEVPSASTTVRRLMRHPSLWMFTLAVLLYLPFLGNFGLIDPWETHYGEVAREVLARGDWLSLWWAQDGWFNSKPILDFWIQALAFASLGVNFHPDGFVSAVSRGLWPQPEWAARLPMVFMALIAHATLYAGVKASWGRRAAFLGSVVWLAMPFWFIIVHQTMTDLPYIAPLATAMGLFLLGFSTDPDQIITHYRVKIRRRAYYISGKTMVLALLLICTLPQILYLVSLNITLFTHTSPYGFNWHWDTFFGGSGGGNCGLPGNEACHQGTAANLQPQPLISALIWTAMLGVTLFVNRRELRTQRFYFLSAWIFIALSALAKELPGVIIALGAVAGWVFVSGRWDLAKRLELPGLLLVFSIIAVPWFLQETVRHGSPFLERLLVHDMYKRAFVHVHDTNSGDDVSFRYYIWQLGYGLFPATGLCAIGFLHWLGNRGRDKPASSFLFLWNLVAFGMFTLTLTKFHHYIIPMVPALALMTGPVLHQALWRTQWPSGERAYQYVVGLVLAAVTLLVGIAWLIPIEKNVAGSHSKYGLLLVLVAAVLLVWTARLLPIARRTESPRGIHLTLLLLGVSAALGTLLVGRDLFTSPPGDVVGPMRLLHLVCYNYSRPWPASLHFEPVMVAFTVAAVLGLLGLAWGGRIRPHGTVFFGIVCCLWTGWCLDYYLIKIAPHWSQRETVIEYYKHRSSAQEWLVAYQMNWKGENIYTGNRLVTFVSSGEKFKKWIEEQRTSAYPTVFVTTEHSRVSSLKNEIGKHRKFDVLTDKELNNKFALVRVEL
jgi:4-amino-4-deoxy-L-arabinose transferase-like glycosyltransferase